MRDQSDVIQEVKPPELNPPKQRKLFGVSHPLLKAVICIVFVGLTGGLGLIVLIIGWLGDQRISKRAKRNISLLACVALLSGCAGTSAKEFTANTQTQMQAEQQAITAADEDVKKTCLKNKPINQFPRNGFVKVMACINNVYEQRVVPVAVYSDLFLEMGALSMEYAEQYQNGEISFELMKSRDDMAYLDYKKAVIQRAEAQLQSLAAQDEAVRQRNMRLLIGNGGATSSRTSCTMYGNSAQCHTY